MATAVSYTDYLYNYTVENERNALPRLLSFGLQRLLLETAAQVQQNVENPVTVLVDGVKAAVNPLDFHLRVSVWLFLLCKTFHDRTTQIQFMGEALVAINARRMEFPHTHWMRSDEDIPAMYWITGMLKSMDDGERTATMESVVTSCAPIVPYADTIRAECKKLYEEASDPDAEPVTPATEFYGPDDAHDEIISYQMMLRMIYKSFYSCYQIYTHINIICKEVEDHSLVGFIVQNKYRDLPVDVSLFIICLLATSPGDAAKLIRATLSLLGDGDCLQPRAMHAIESMLDGFDESEEFPFDDTDLLARAKKIYTKEDPNPDPTHSHHIDITALNNFVRIARRYRTDRYVQQAFVSSSDILSISYLDDFMIIEPATKDGDMVDFVYIPLVDDLNDRKPVVAKYWRSDSHIDMLSEAEYRKEVQNLTTDDDGHLSGGDTITDPNNPIESTVEGIS